MNESFLNCRPLPAINETFPFQFNRPITLLSPLDLSLRASNAIPITPPSTPSPPRKRQRFMTDENYLWRPHFMEEATPTSAATAVDNLTYARADVLDGKNNKNNYLLERYNLEDIQQSQEPESTPSQQQQQPQQQRCQRLRVQCDLPTIYVDDDETILLTEDEDETLASSHDYTDEVEEDEEEEDDDDEVTEVRVSAVDSDSGQHKNNDLSSDEMKENKGVGEREEKEEDEEDVYVDILSNDDDEVNPLSVTTLLRLQNQPAVENVPESSGKVLTRTKLIYDDEELHNRAVDGLAKLFECDFRQEGKGREKNSTKTYMDLTTGRTSASPFAEQHLSHPLSAAIRSTHQSKLYKSGERKRMKLRKHLPAQDEDNISPVSGTIIRKLRADEQLVVRKGDIDPAFNVVEITEEAKAILASIDNKIGAYLCQLCRTLYDDAFQLAQHRCPRIVHIEYKCSECEKVFNCPANLASHRRWHKPKLDHTDSNGQTKQPHLGSASTAAQLNSASSNSAPVLDKEASNESKNDEGIFPCQQCGKTFRRHSYLKKHLASHQMLDNLKSLNIFKNCSPVPNFRTMPPYQPVPYRGGISTSTTSHLQPAAANQYVTAASASASATATGATQPPPTASFYHHHNTQLVNAGTVGQDHQQTASKVYPQRFGVFSLPPTPLEQRRFYTLEELYLSQHFERNSAFQYVQAKNAAAASNFLTHPAVPSLMSMSVK